MTMPRTKRASQETSKPPKLGARKPLSPGAIAVGIAIIVAAVFSLVPGFDFLHYDDNLHVWQNPHILHLSPQNLAFFWSHPYEQLYIPLSYMFFALLAAISGQHSPAVSSTGSLFNPFVFHVASLILHVANTLIVFVILRRLTKADWPSAAGALLFGLHPLQVESVAWISEIRGLLGSFFVLASIHAYLYSATRNRTICITALSLFILALLSKPSVAAIPVVMFILDRWVLGRTLNKAALFVAPYLVVSAAFVLIAHGVQHLPAEALTPLWARPLIALDSLSFYLEKLVAPVDLAPIYGRTPAFVFAHNALAVGWIAPVVLTIAAWALRKRFAAFGVAFAIMAAALLPTSGLVPFAFQAISTTADRYFYLPMLGAAYLLTAVLAAYGSLVVVALSVAALLACGTLSYTQSAVWQNTLTLFTYAAGVNPRSALIFLDLGNGLRDQHKYDDAIKAYQHAEVLDPRDYRPALNAAILLNTLGDGKDALIEIVAANRLKPGDTRILLSMANLYSSVGDNRSAIAAYRQCLAIDPGTASAYNNLGLALMAENDANGAVDAFQHAVTLSPTTAGFRDNLAVATQQAKKK